MFVPLVLCDNLLDAILCILAFVYRVCGEKEQSVLHNYVKSSMQYFSVISYHIIVP